MGSLVGASDEIRRAGGPDSSMNDYAVRISFPIASVWSVFDMLSGRLYDHDERYPSRLQ
jgi:cytokinesis protein